MDLANLTLHEPRGIIPLMGLAVEIDLDTARELLPVLETSLKTSQQQRADLDQRIARLTRMIDQLRTKISGSELPLLDDPSGRRLSRGEAPEIIFNLFKGLPPGTALRLSEIKSRTALRHSTVHRALNDPKQNAGRFVREGKNWKIADGRLVIKI